ncbi:MAG: uncharacterized protein KVP18_004975 [Porospora cf. gigantea A]|uniref:uncharacterized protein n=1 Tax=Porospora cf. gigantea A TaxID=2853593 RepID=UPI00355A26EF|nr:MAG: hypothetical protein KVP18_004975 [Porospora cf. gigantea A]
MPSRKAEQPMPYCVVPYPTAYGPVGAYSPVAYSPVAYTSTGTYPQVVPSTTGAYPQVVPSAGAYPQVVPPTPYGRYASPVHSKPRKDSGDYAVKHLKGGCCACCNTYLCCRSCDRPHGSCAGCNACGCYDRPRKVITRKESLLSINKKSRCC